METRQIRQVKVFFLILNPVTDRLESRRVVAVSPERPALVSWYNSHRTEPWSDGQYHKYFRKGSALEWLNPLIDSEFTSLGYHGHGISEEWMAEDLYAALPEQAAQVGFELIDFKPLSQIILINP